MMVDLHNHILPGVDDGARDLAEALDMARQAVKEGTSILAATPHRYYSNSEMQGSNVQEYVLRLQKSLDQHEIPLRLLPGVEIPMKPDTIEALKSGRLIPIGGPDGKYVLIEPPFEFIPSYALPLLESVQELGLTPIVAHPERNGEVQRSLAFVEECVRRGMIIQLTAGSIVGKFGARPLACAESIARHTDWPIIIASDAHDPRDRTTADLALASERVGEWTGDNAAAGRMVEELPISLVPTVYWSR